jgi:hypothetical protein
VPAQTQEDKQERDASKLEIPEELIAGEEVLKAVRHTYDDDKTEQA